MSREEILKEINSLKDDVRKPSDVIIAQSLRIVKEIPDKLLECVPVDNVYISKFGTLIIDFEFDNGKDELSLEIAKKAVGWFTDGIIRKQVDSINIEGDITEAVDMLLKDLNTLKI